MTNRIKVNYFKCDRCKFVYGDVLVDWQPGDPCHDLSWTKDADPPIYYGSVEGMRELMCPGQVWPMSEAEIAAISA